MSNVVPIAVQIQKVYEPKKLMITPRQILLSLMLPYIGKGHTYAQVLEFILGLTTMDATKTMHKSYVKMKYFICFV